jgi:hypothetical protein
LIELKEWLLLLTLPLAKPMDLGFSETNPEHPQLPPLFPDL